MTYWRLSGYVIFSWLVRNGLFFGCKWYRIIKDRNSANRQMTGGNQLKKLHILMVNLPYSGHTNPTLPLAKALVGRGHSVTYINAEAFREPVEKTGAKFEPYGKYYPEHPTENQKKRMSFRAAFDTALEIGERENPDLLVYEMFFHPGIEVAKRLQIPCVRQFSQSAWSEAAWNNAPKMFRLSARLIDRQILSYDDIRHMGIIGRSSLHDGIIGAKPELNIVYLPEQFQPERDSLDEKYVFTVPHPERETGEIKIPFDEMKKPIVYISLGSIISNKGFCKECIRAFGGKEFSVILTTGKIASDSLGKIPPNIFAYSFVPQIEVLRHADVFLTHCGMNSVNEALCAGVPMVAMPFINDQVMNAARLTELGLAKRVRSFPSSGRQLLRTVREVAADGEMKARAEEMRRVIENQPGMDSIVEKIENII